MSKIPFEVGFVSSRRGFLKRGLGLGVGGLVAGCGRTVLGVSMGQSTTGPGLGGDPGPGPGPGPNTPTDPTQPTNPPTDPTPPPKPPTDPTPPPNPPPDPTPPPPANLQPTLTGSVSQVNASVTTTQLGSVGTDFVGFSFEKSELTTASFRSGKTNIVNLFKALGPSLVRIGGSAVDRIVWKPSGSRVSNTIIKSDIDEFALFARQTGWRVIYGIGLLNRSAANPADLAAAADEAQYVIDKMGDIISHFTLGNEPDNASYTSSDNFNASWLAFKNVIVTKVGNRAFAGPDVTGSGDAIRYTKPFAEYFAKIIGKGNITLLTHHFYQLSSDRKKVAWSVAEFIKTLLTFPTANTADGRKLADNLAIIKGAADTLGVKFRITEANSATSGGEPDVSDVYASALWSLDFMFRAAQGGASGVNFHGGDNPFYTPFSFTSSSLVDIRPLYYAMLFFTMMGSGPVLSSSIDASGQNISIYSIKTASGFSILFVNKEVSQSFDVSLQLPNSVSSATSVYLKGPGLSSKTGISIQDATVSVITGNLGPYTSWFVPVSGNIAKVNVPALTAVLVKVS